MNKRGLIKYICILISAIISFYFLITSNIGFGTSFFSLSILFLFIFALTIFMFCKKDKIKKNKFIYDVILLLLMIFTVVCLGLFIYDYSKCYFDVNCSIDFENVFILLYPIILFIMILFNFSDIYNKTNKMNDILTIMVSILIILIHLRYYLEPNFIHKLVEDSLYVQYSHYYVTQNYIYFIILYLVVLIHREVNKR